MTSSETIIGIIAKYLGVSPQEITPTTNLVNDLGADSLDLLEILITIEDTLGLDIPNATSDTWVTVQDVIDYVQFLE